MTRDLEIRVLGPQRLRVRGQELALGSRHAERLLIFLAVHPGPHQRRELASLLFSQADRVRARTYLRQALQRLRQSRPRLLLEVDADRIALARTQPLWLDYTELLRADEDDPASCRAAIALHRGDFLETESPSDASSDWWGWVCDQRRIVEAKLSSLFEALLHTTEHRDGEALWPLLEEWMRKQPLLDRPCREAMAFLARKGRVTESLHLYTQYEERRVTTTGQKPGAELRALRDRLRAETFSPRLSTPLPAPSPGHPAHRRFLTVLAIALDAEKEAVSDLSIEAHLNRCYGLARQVGDRYGGSVRVGGGGTIEIVFGLEGFPQDGPLNAVQAALSLRRLSPPGHFPRLGVHCGRTLVGVDGQPLGTLSPIAHAAAWANHQRRGLVLTERAVQVLSQAETALPGNLLPPVVVYGRTVMLYWLANLPLLAPRVSSQPLIGRGDVYGKIQSAATEVLAGGAGRLIWIVGDPGVGKTHLLRHVARDLSGQMSVVEYACQPLYRDSFLHPVASLVEQVFGLDRTHPERSRQQVQQHLYALGERDPLVHRLWLLWLHLLPEETGLGLLQDYRTVLFDSVLDMLGSQLFPQTRTLVVEDFHWADTGSLDMLRRYLAILHEKPVLMLISSRQRLPFLEGVAQYEDVLLLEPWDPDTTAQFLRTLPWWRTSPEREAAIIARTGGVPLYVDQLARLAESTGDTALPWPIQAILDGQIARATSSLDLLQAAAVVGEAFSLSLLQRLLPLRSPETLAREAQRLSDLGLWQCVRELWTFRHELLREATYTAIPQESLQRWHRLVAGILEAEGVHHPDVIAHHYAAGGDGVRAAEYRILAARRALVFEQFDQAEAGFATAARWLTSQGADTLLAQALSGQYLIRAVRQGYAARPTQEALEALESVCTRLDPQETEQLVARYGRWMIDAGRLGARAAWSRARHFGDAEYAGIPVPVAQGIAEYAMGWSRFWLGDLDRARDHLRRAVDLWQESHADIVAWTTCERYREAAIAYWSMIEVMQGRVRSGYRRCAQAVDDLDGLPYAHTQLFLRCMQMSMGFWSGDVHASLRIAQQVIRVSEARKLALWGIFARAVSAWAAVRLGRIRPRRGLARIRACLGDVRRAWRFGAGFIHLLEVDVVCRAGIAIRPVSAKAHAHLRRHAIRVLVPDLGAGAGRRGLVASRPATLKSFAARRRSQRKTAGCHS